MQGKAARRIVNLRANRLCFANLDLGIFDLICLDIDQSEILRNTYEIAEAGRGLAIHQSQDRPQVGRCACRPAFIDPCRRSLKPRLNLKSRIPRNTSLFDGQVQVSPSIYEPSFEDAKSPNEKIDLTIQSRVLAEPSPFHLCSSFTKAFFGGLKITGKSLRIPQPAMRQNS